MFCAFKQFASISLRLKFHGWTGVFLLGCLAASPLQAVDEAAATPSATTPEWYSETRYLYFDIAVRVTYYPANTDLTRRVWEYLEGADDVFNDFKSTSEISHINQRNAAGDVLLSPALEEAFAKSFFAYEKSEGMFDITCAPLRHLWRKGRATNTVPTPEAIAAVRQTCGMNLVTLHTNRLTLSKPGIQFDFGGMDKGMFVDHAVEILKAGHVQNALVQVGGETCAFGLSEKKRPYRIAIQHPLDHTNTWCVVKDPGQGFSASTSGNYEQPLVINGQTYYHIFNVKTGMPANTAVLSVSVVFPGTGKNWLADCMTKPGVLLGPEKLFSILKDQGGEALFLLLEDGKIREVKSPGWKRFE